MKKPLFVCILCLSIFLLFSACSKQLVDNPKETPPQNASIEQHDASIASQEKYKLGNPMPNCAIRFTGLLDTGEWLYFSTFSGFFKTNDDFHTVYKLDSIPAYSINVIDDWIYYLRPQYSMEFPLRRTMEDGVKQFDIWKMKTDGTENQSLNVRYARELCVINDRIYFIHKNTTLLMRMNIDGRELTTLTAERAILPIVYQDTMYCAIRSAEDPSATHGIFEIDEDGNLLNKISNANTTNYTIEDGWIYYCDQENSFQLMRVKTDGSAEESYGDIQSYNFTSYNGILYYIGYSISELGRDGYLIRHDLQTKEETELWTDVHGFDLSGQHIYLHDFSNDGQGAVPFRMQQDGTAVQIIP